MLKSFIISTKPRHFTNPIVNLFALNVKASSFSTLKMATMKAAVVYESGGPEVLKVEQRPIPQPKPGQVLINIKAFGLNRAEMFTRQGHSPSVKWPRIIGIEAVGVVESAPGGEFEKGQKVATCMGGLGREFDGGYAEYTCPPAAQVQAVASDLDWATLGALPEMLQTAWGSLFDALRLQAGDALLIRGGTSSVGLAAAAIAKQHGAHVTATTRSARREALLLEHGADAVIVDDGGGPLAPKAAAARPRLFDKVLELVGTTTLADSLRCARPGGIVCMTGILGGSWTMDSFAPMDVIPQAVCLTRYGGGPEEFMRTPLGELAEMVKAGTMKVGIGRVFRLDEIVEAHRLMESDQAGGKIVVLP